LIFIGDISIKSVLITGGAGFVGRHFAEFFLKKKYQVDVVDNIAKFTGGIDPNKYIWPLYNPLDFKNFKFENLDCREWFKQNQNKYYDYVFHLAAMVGGRELIENNPIAVSDDLAIDSSFWQWAVISKPKKVVCFSSSACYPIKFQKFNNYKLLSEEIINLKNDIGAPDLTYGWAKLTCEYLAKIAYEKYGIQSVIYRPFSGYGEDQDLNYPFPSICKRVLKNQNEKEIKVWGSGKQMRDFIHIDDCVNGVISTMDKIYNAEPLNLSTGKYTSFIEFVTMACDILGYNPNVIGSSLKPEGVFARGGDIKKQSAYGFKAKIDFKNGIELALNKFAKQM